MFCGKCGNKLDDDARFCTACGAPTEGPMGSETEVQVTEEVAQPQQAPTADSAQSTAAQVTPVQSPVPAQPMSSAQPAPTQMPVAAQATPAQPTTAQAQSPAQPTSTQPAPAQPPTQPPAPAAPRKSKGKPLAIGAICVVVAALIGVGGFFFWQSESAKVRITPDSFPNDVIRTAISDQLDINGNGVLEPSEAESVTALVYTPVGAEFIVDGSDFDAQSVRTRIYDAAGVTPEQALEAASIDTPNPLQKPQDKPQPFTGLQNLVMPGCGLTALDLQEFPQLTYVDLRDNPIQSLDLSGNAELTTLYCNPDVGLIGLEEAGLYFTDLLTAETVTDSRGNTTTTAVEYDTLGRPVKAGSKTYAYDDQGRLTSATTGTDGARFEKFQYGANGQLSVYSYNLGLEAGVAPKEVYYGYGADGLLNSVGEGAAGQSYQAADFSLVDGSASSYQASNGAGFFSYDADGRMTRYQQQARASGQATGERLEFTYRDDGGIVWNNCRYGGDGLTGIVSGSVSVSSDDFPEAGSRIDGNSHQDATFQCNADGYVTNIHWGADSSGARILGNADAQISYVKRVGALADRVALRYVPVFRVSALSPVTEPAFGWTISQDWHGTTALQVSFGVFEWQPQNMLGQSLGLCPQLVSNPNERELAAFDRAHWLDGVSPDAGNQPIEKAEVKTLLENVAAGTPITNPAAFKDDPVYGPVAEAYFDALMYAHIGREPAGYEKGPYIDDTVLTAFMETGLIRSGKSASGASIAFAYRDLDGDGTDELLVTAPRTAFSDSGNFIIAVYGNDKGTAKLLLSSPNGRNSLCVLSDGRLLRHESGGMDLGASTLYEIQGATATKVSSIGWDYVDSKKRGGSDDLYKLSIEENGNKTERTIAYKDLGTAINEVIGESTPAVIQWTLYPCFILK